MKFPIRLKESDWLCFLHISKTGGLTFLPLLDRMFPPEQRLDHHNVKLLDPSTLGSYRLVRSHGTYDELRRVRPEPPVWLTFLREPIARALSTYKYMVRTEHHEAAELIRGKSFDEFVFGPPELTVYIADYQARILTSNLDSSLPVDVDLALSRLEEFAFVGLTERYEDSLDLLCYSLCWPPFPSVERKNTTLDPLRVEDLQPKTLARLRDLNRADAKVYELGERLFRERRAQMMEALLWLNAQQGAPTDVPALAKQIDRQLELHDQHVREVMERLKAKLWG